MSPSPPDTARRRLLALLRPYARPSGTLSFAPCLNVRARWVAGLGAGGDTVCEEGGIVVDEAEQGRASGVLPGQGRWSATRRWAASAPAVVADGSPQDGSSTTSSPSGGKSEGEAGVRTSIGTILASLLLPYPCSILLGEVQWADRGGLWWRGGGASVDRDQRRGKGPVHAVAGSPRESRPRSVRSAAMARAVWLFTAPQLMPIAAATSASERSA